MKIDYESEEFQEAARVAGFESVEAAAKAVKRVLGSETSVALESIDAEEIPQEIIWLALSVNARGHRICAIKCAPHTTYEPDGPIADDDKLRWSLGRLGMGRKRPDDPLARECTKDGWYFLTTGNPITIEHILRSQGYTNAIAGRPTVCFVCYVGEERPDEAAGTAWRALHDEALGEE